MEAPRLDWTCKGLPPAAEGCTGADLGALGLDLLAGDLMMPAAVIREAALASNIAAMQAFADRIGAHLCPHGKTSMSPELFRMQIEAGAWGMTAATAHHVRIYRRLGIGRILLASQLAARADVDWVLDELERDPAFDFYCLADSAEAVDLLADAAERRRLRRPLQLLVETGFPEGRAGARGLGEALAVARRIAASPRLALRGIETFEGIRQTRADARLEALEMLDLAVAAAEAMVREDLAGDGPLLFSAGGSAFLDLCAERLPREISGRRVEKVIRPGCYVTHDHGLYERLTHPGGARPHGLPKLEPALEVWGAVLSLPEPGLGIVGLGKRDVSSDLELPQPILMHRPGGAGPPRCAEGLSTRALWDQHASLSCPAGALAVGDLVGFGISHPCATFDRWRALLTVDADYRVTGAVTTIF